MPEASAASSSPSEALTEKTCVNGINRMRRQNPWESSRTIGLWFTLSQNFATGSNVKNSL